MLIQVHDNLGIFTAQFQVQRVDTLDFIADSDAARAKDAAVSVDDKEIMC